MKKLNIAIITGGIVAERDAISTSWYQPERLFGLGGRQLCGE